MISLSTIYADLSALTAEELEKVQLAVNAEVGVRIQNERLARRIEKAITDAQAVGFSDTDISQAIEDAKVAAHTGKVDPALDKSTPVEPEKRGPAAATPPKTK